MNYKCIEEVSLQISSACLFVKLIYSIFQFSVNAIEIQVTTKVMDVNHTNSPRSDGVYSINLRDFNMSVTLS